MSDKINDGGPAYPRAAAWDYRQERFFDIGGPGMTLRDYFAGQALTIIPHVGCGAELSCDEMAHDAYAYADAMLKAREVGNG